MTVLLMAGPEPLGSVRLRHHSEETSTTRQPRCQPITASTLAATELRWARAFGLDAASLDQDTALVAFADTPSLALCGELGAPLQLDAPGRTGARRSLRLMVRPEDPTAFTLSPWPFRREALVLEGEARPLPPEGCFSSEAAMRTLFASPERVVFRARLAPG